MRSTLLCAGLLMAGLAQAEDKALTCNENRLGQTESVLLATAEQQRDYRQQYGRVPDGAYTLVQCAQVVASPAVRAMGEGQSYAWVITRAGDGVKDTGAQ